MNALANRWIIMLLALLAVAAGQIPTAQAADAGADALPVHVVAVKTLEALDQATALTAALKKAVRSSDGWSLADSSQALEFLAIQMKCSEPIDAACEARIADHLKADRYLWAVLDIDEGDKTFVSGKLNFFVRGKGTNTVDMRYSANLTDSNDDSIIQLAKSMLDQVTGGAPQGTLKISSGGVAGQLFVDGEPLGALAADGGSFSLPSGAHEIVVKAPGYADAQASVNIKPATTVETSVTMVEDEAPAPIDWRMVSGFGLVGVGVATGAVGLWSALEVNSIRNDPVYQRFQSATIEGEFNTCSAADLGPDGPSQNAYNTGQISGQPVTTPGDADVVSGLCNDAKSFEILQAVMFPVAAVSAGVGVYLLGTSSLFGGDGEGPDEATAWQIKPIMRPGLGAMSVSYQF
jgi:hypothetical protein